MAIYLAASTSLEYWRRERLANEWHGGLASLLERGGVLRAGAVTRVRRVGNEMPGNEVVQDVLENELIGMTRPIEAFVREGARLIDTTLCRSRLCSRDVPIGSFVRVSRRLYVSSPEFCFLQKARELSIGSLVCLGLELCGVYVRRGGADSGLARSAPLCTPSSLGSFLKRSSGIHGVRGSSRAVSHLVANSASPMESILVSLLCLPRMLGGYGLPKPVMNARVNVKHGGLAASYGSFYLCDLYWPQARLAVEYDSDFAHTGSERIASDAERRNSLIDAGITVITVTKRQAYSMPQFDDLAHQVARHLGKRLREGAARYDAAARRGRLRREILLRGTPADAVVDYG